MSSNNTSDTAPADNTSGIAVKWNNIMKKLAFESKGLQRRLKKFQNLSRSKNKILDAQIPELSPSEVQALLPLLQSFTTRHQSHHRPIALVTSGGTAADLELNSVRYLDNFSTGMRGAISVEEFLKRGYAVIHLWREGSAAPYSRLLGQMLEVKQGNHGLHFDSLGNLFHGQLPEEEEDEEEEDNGNHARGTDSKQESKDDPWLTSTRSTQKSTEHKTQTKNHHIHSPNGTHDDHHPVSTASTRTDLTKKILNSTHLQTKLRERSDVVKGGLLLTVPFRTVEQYLAKLKLCSQAINDCQSLGLIYLAAAVSDFYIPHEQKSKHKIQSRNYKIPGMETMAADNQSAIRMDPNTNCLHLKLSPVPKVLSLIRDEYAPHSFCISFKLETDKNILIEKARMAMNKYDVHMVIGNELKTRYEKLLVLQNREMYASAEDDENHDGGVADGDHLDITEITKTDASSSSMDQLEDAMISHVVEKHFEYISNHYLSSSDQGDGEGKESLPRTALMAGAEAAARHNAYLREKKLQLQNELYWKRVRDMTLNAAGHAIGMYLTFVASSAIQRRMK